MVGSQTLSGAAITDLYTRISEGRLHEAPSPGALDERDIGEDYVQRIAGDIQLGTPLKVVVDAGNGVAGVIGPRSSKMTVATARFEDESVKLCSTLTRW